MNNIVYGLGISGISCAKFLAKNHENIIATDDNNSSIENFRKSLPENSTITLLKPDEIEYNKDDIVIFSPGIPLFYPKKHKILEIKQEKNIELICDIELFYQKNSKNNFIGITGTNGKSTTTALIGFIFEKLNFNSAIGGNIGKPCFELLQNQQNFSYIFECSSYQIDLFNKIRFQIASLLNITPDHIDRHGSIEGYIEAKKKIFKNQKEGDFAIINIDDEITKKIFDELKSDKNFKANLIAISSKNRLEEGISYFNNELTCNILDNKFNANFDSKYLKGLHNSQNIAFAFANVICFSLAKNIKIDENLIVKAIQEFEGLKHRNQILGKYKNITFVNDSKATNAESTKNSLLAFDNIFLILGGRAKENGINDLVPLFNKVRKIYLIGEATEEFAKVLEKNNVAFEKSKELNIAFQNAFLDAKKLNLEANIILSPACSSFDQWKNFEERGDYFCKLFDELHKK